MMYTTVSSVVVLFIWTKRQPRLRTSADSVACAETMMMPPR